MDDLVSFIVGIVLFAPFTVPHDLLEGGRPPPACGWSFLPFPYASGARGYLEEVPCSTASPSTVPPTSTSTFPAPGGSLDPRPPRGAPSRTVAWQLWLEGLASMDGTYGRLQTRARFLTAARFELDAAYGAEIDAKGESPDGGWIGQTHAAVRFAQSRGVTFRAGAGIRNRVVRDKGFFGFDALYGADIYWPAPVTTSLEVTGGSLGVKGWAAETRATVGYAIGHCETYAGWDAQWLGAPRQRTEPIGGPTVGVRAYF